VRSRLTAVNQQYPNPYVTPKLCFSFHYFALRKLHLLLRAKALVAFPGGYGTLDELFEALTLIQTRKIKPIPVVLVGEAYWRRAFDIDFLVAEGVIDSGDRELFWFAETAEEIWNGILRWHNASGQPLQAESFICIGPAMHSSNLLDWVNDFDHGILHLIANGSPSPSVRFPIPQA
jgi:predicted Rossmann-fold nucleotide-binding protein